MMRRKTIYLTVVLALIFIGFSMMQLTSFKKYLAERLAAQIHEKTGWTLAYEDVRGILPFYLQLDKITLTKEQNQDPLVLKSATISLAPHTLFLATLRGQLSLYPTDSSSDKTVVTLDKKLYGGLSITVEEKRQGILKALYSLPEAIALQMHLQPLDREFEDFDLSITGLCQTTGDKITLTCTCKRHIDQLQCHGKLTTELTHCGIEKPLTADVNLHIENNQLQLYLTTPITSLGSYQIEGAAATLTFDMQHKSGMLTALGHLDQMPVKMRSSIGMIDSYLQFDALHLEAADKAIDGRCVVNIPQKTVKTHFVFSGNIASLFEDYSHRNVDGKFSIDASLSFDDPSTDWRAHISCDGEIAPILELLLDSDSNAISGMATLSAEVASKDENIGITATIDVVNASYELLRTGAVFKDIHAIFESDGKQLILKELNGIDGNGGIAKAEGSISLRAVDNYPFDLTINLDRVLGLHLDYARAQATGKLRLHGNTKEATLSGALEVNEALITIPEQSSLSLKMLDVTYINQPIDELLPKHFAATPTEWPLYLDMQIHMPKHAFVNGKKWKSEWHGDIHLTGTTDNPQLQGNAQAISGEYSFNGRSLISQQSTITFAGDPTHKTSLYLTAATEIEEIRIEVVFKGLISDPKLSFHSNPTMSEKEILSWLLFNKGLREITPFEGAELSRSIVTLSGGDGDEDLLSRLRRSLGIDRVDISSSDTGESSAVSLRVGKYLSKGLFISFDKGINSDINQVSLEATLTKRLKVQAEIGDDAEGKLHLKWKRDY
jgi:hypothetical protein